MERMLTDRVAIVTGASRGIGRAVAEELAANGASVVVNYLSNETAAAEVVQVIEEAGGVALALQADVSDFKAAQELIKGTIKGYGQIDILVNNAGATRDKLILMMKEADWDTVLDTNLKSMFNCSKAALRPMLRRREPCAPS